MKRNITIDGIYNPNYSVDHNGNVFNKEGYKMTTYYTHDGYQRERLQRGCPRKMYRVHRIVCETFFGINIEKPVVNHINGVRDDNRLENIDWCTFLYNSALVPIENRQASAKQIEQLTLDGELVSLYDSMVKAEEVTGIARQNISKVCRGVRNHAGGFQWRYLECPTTIEQTSH